MNSFQLSFPELLSEWSNLRKRIKSLPVQQQCIAIDDWWQQAPLINHHLHWQDEQNWPDPWSLLSENTYCTLTRAVGMCYTLLMNDITDVELMFARDMNAEEHYLVIVDKPKYVMNWWPSTVISNHLSSFQIINSKSLESLKNKIK